MTFILTMCTYGILGVCSQIRYASYPTESQCYTAMESLYKAKGTDSFLYIICSPEKPKTEQEQAK